MRTFGIAAFVAFLIDQISKYVVIHMMELARIRSIDVLPPVLNFRYGENRGINFGRQQRASDPGCVSDGGCDPDIGMGLCKAGQDIHRPVR